MIGYLVETNSSSPLLLSAVQLLAKGMRHDSTDIRLLTSFVAGHISWRTRLSARGCKSDVAAVAAVSDSVKSDLSTASTAVLVTTGGDWLKCLIGLLVNGTRERAGPVRLASETAIVLLCRLGAPGAGEGAAVQVSLFDPPVIYLSVAPRM
ncbi:unnamed protein product [Protopolystoma xenopodis]|uniref:Uncharacterized protein n=1 Tax=Protopolystoma xenopodis TaxID=117903 RepID=A0A448XAE9_9PLAT|nr:unnamed protein product [Protopolystoma xenopodis]